MFAIWLDLLNRNFEDKIGELGLAIIQVHSKLNLLIFKQLEEQFRGLPMKNAADRSIIVVLPVTMTMSIDNGYD